MAKRRYTTYRPKKRRNTNIKYIVITVISLALLYYLLPMIWKSADTKQKQTASENPPAAARNAESTTATADAGQTVDKTETPKESQPQETTQPQSGSSESNTTAAAGTDAAAQQPQPQDEEALRRERTRELLADANKDIAAGRIIAARYKLNTLIYKDLDPYSEATIKEHLAKLSDIWLFSSNIYPEDSLCGVYTVEAGDNLTRIAKQYSVPWELIAQINGISRPENIRVGQKLKVVKGPFHAIIYLSRLKMDLYLQQTYIKTYEIGIGRKDHDTPTGMWMVARNGKMIKPDWTDPDTGRSYTAKDPDYPLGERWIALEGVSGDAKGRTGFAIHGTNDPDSIGTRSSRGCIRMFNTDVVEVYKLLEPGKSQVQIRN